MERERKERWLGEGQWRRGKRRERWKWEEAERRAVEERGEERKVGEGGG